MLCPYCRTEFFEAWSTTYLETHGGPVMKGGLYSGRSLCPRADMTTCPKCKGATIDLKLEGPKVAGPTYATIRVMPRGGAFSPAPPEVPAVIAADYAEANEVLPISAKASA